MNSERMVHMMVRMMPCCTQSTWPRTRSAWCTLTARGTPRMERMVHMEDSERVAHSERGLPTDNIGRMMHSVRVVHAGRVLYMMHTRTGALVTHGAWCSTRRS